MFSLPDNDLINRYGSQLSNHNGQNFQHLVIKYQSKHWLVKPSSDAAYRNKEVLAYLLGQQFTNMAETSHLDNGDAESIRKLGITIDNNKVFSCLTRVAQDYLPDELKLKTIESVTAGELVFSTLIRRRDAHEYNRAYVAGIPVFFDNHISFRECTADDFFREVGKGYAGSWRVIQIENEGFISTMFRDTNWSDRHFVYDTNKFESEARRVAKEIIEDTRNWSDLVKQAGFAGEDAIHVGKILEENRRDLTSDVEKMLQIVKTR